MQTNIIFISGHFNVLHPGHLRLLRFAKEFGGKLIIGVESDRIAAGAAHVHEQLRLEGVQSISWVDEAFLMDEFAETAIKRLRPDIVIKGKEHESRFNSELSVVEQYGGKLLFSSGEVTFSSYDLIKKEFSDAKLSSITLPKEYINRHDIKNVRLQEILTNFSKLKVCVIGDVIVDEYITCEPLGMSQEDPTIVVRPLDSIKFVGGAAIVAAHAAGLGASVEFISVTGNDASREFTLSELELAGVHSFLIADDSRPTTLKQRYRSKGKSLLRVSYLHQGAISIAHQNLIFEKIEKIIKNIDLLVFSDFNYGCLPQMLVDRICIVAKANNVMLAADSQSSSQTGDISRYKGMNLLTPTEREARIGTRNQEDGLVVLAEQLKQQSKAVNILLKLGEEGLLVHAGSEKPEDWLTDRVEALNSSPKDVAGAGDSLLITAAMTMACGGSIWEAACLGSLAAAIQVSRIGNTPLKVSELTRELSR